ncbi:hypothetical protein F3Y22_tig00112614pilonHSYRG00105 [Hibiscus syriacus]|uniref:HMA domain-containing protein n=1 Tax=Hibiscus syriacus TaxID=106335 RepID=A0A6A2Y1H1_HIBSY|nr:heavy metal-associated isoprenylated plant protein 36-like [Hibiscus syriacus]KAE8665469.1 hypothetical protein F3Y22_tig00112614pilonHSYRG00105 [Hibiscus syriacus]
MATKVLMKMLVQEENQESSSSHDGVYETKIDSQQHKVTVISSVDAETLIKRLTKSGKHVELWPELKPEKKDKKPGKTNNNDKQKDGGVEAGADDNHGRKNNNSAEKPKPAASKNGGASAAAAVKGSARDKQHPTGDQMGRRKRGTDPQSTCGGNKKKEKFRPKRQPWSQGRYTTRWRPCPTRCINRSEPSESANVPSKPFLYGSPFCGVSNYYTTCPNSTSSYLPYHALRATSSTV